MTTPSPPPRPLRPGPALRTALAGLLALPALLTGCRDRAPAGYQGYLEGEFVYVAAPLSGRLTRLAVTRGAGVQAGDLLFELDPTAEAAAVDEASRRHAQAQARLDNLRKGQRPSELAALQAQLQRAEASLHWAESDLERRRQLFRDGVISPAELDLAASHRDAEQAQVNALRADLQTAALGAREDEIRAAEDEAAAAAAALERARWALDNKRQSAPAAGRVHDTLYREGEFVGTGLPVVALLPPTNLKARFFVPQADLPGLPVGAAVRLHLDGLTSAVPARVTYIATRAEYTPPVIYSQENRAKLVFMVEALPELPPGTALHPGQPVDVTRAP